MISNSNDTHIQVMVNAINQLLGNYGSTILLDKTLQTRQGIDEDFENFVTELKSGSISGILCWGVNPVYNHPAGEEIKTGIKKYGAFSFFF